MSGFVVITLKQIMKQTEFQKLLDETSEKLVKVCGETGRGLLIISENEDENVSVTAPVSLEKLVYLLTTARIDDARFRRAVAVALKPRQPSPKITRTSIFPTKPCKIKTPLTKH